jgi:hypothetical protein
MPSAPQTLTAESDYLAQFMTISRPASKTLENIACFVGLSEI